MLVSEAIREQWGEVEITLNCPEGCEGDLSRSWCQGCGSNLGGDRHSAVAWHLPPAAWEHTTYGDTERVDIKVCVDCLFYLANGEDTEVGMIPA